MSSPLRYKAFDLVDGCAVLVAGGDQELKVLPVLGYQAVALDDFIVFLMYKRNVKENDIFQVYDKELGSRIGWVFPVQALGSLEHNFVDNEHFLNYAKAAFHLLCMGDEVGQSFVADGNIEPVLISDLFHSSTVVFCVSKPILKKHGLDIDFDITGYFAYFLKNGYVPAPLCDPSGIFLERVPDVKSGGRLYVKKINLENGVNNIAIRFLVDAIPFVGDSVLMFFYCYQVVEVFIDMILRRECSGYLERINLLEDCLEVRSLCESISSAFNEQARVKKLFSRIQGLSQANDLLAHCNELLNRLGREPCVSVGEALYKTRCLMFHNYKSLFVAERKDECEKIIELVTSRLFDCLCEIVCIE